MFFADDDEDFLVDFGYVGGGVRVGRHSVVWASFWFEGIYDHEILIPTFTIYHRVLNCFSMVVLRSTCATKGMAVTCRI